MTETLTDRLRAASEVAYEEEMCLLITKEELAHAAAEIERLTAENERLREAIRGLVTAFDDDAESFGSSSAMDRARGMIDHQQLTLNSEEGK